jgi:HNH endonuclease
VIDVARRRLVRARAGNRCEYCLIHQVHVALPHHVEHIVARKHGGSDDLFNLCLACERCNLFKGSDLTGIDPATGQVERLYDPRTQDWAHHFELRGPLIVGRTATGRATVEVLAMNAGQRIPLRAALIAHSLYP